MSIAEKRGTSVDRTYTLIKFVKARDVCAHTMKCSEIGQKT